MKRILLGTLVFSTLAFAKTRESTKQVMVALGADFPVSRTFDKHDPHYAFALGFAWDLDSAFLEARGDYMNRFSTPGQSYTSFTFGANFPFYSEEQWAAFAGAHFGFGFTKVEGLDTKGGFEVGPDVGAIFLRNADVNLDARLRLIYNTADLNDSHPTILAFLVGLRF